MPQGWEVKQMELELEEMPLIMERVTMEESILVQVEEQERQEEEMEEKGLSI
jgi:hypothetical protein